MTTTMVSARLHQELACELQRTADQDSRSRSGQLEHLVKLGLAARQRAAELERLASAAATEAARAHLREHARLSNIPEESQL